MLVAVRVARGRLVGGFGIGAALLFLRHGAGFVLARAGARRFAGRLVSALGDVARIVGFVLA
ncbi:MAG: hypothetical protein ACXU68_11260, partial [Croceibacterium sp.]